MERLDEIAAIAWPDRRARSPLSPGPIAWPERLETFLDTRAKASGYCG